MILIWALDIYDAKNALEKEISNKVNENLEEGYKSNENTLLPPNFPTAEKLTGLFLQALICKVWSTWQHCQITRILLEIHDFRTHPASIKIFMFNTP